MKTNGIEYVSLATLALLWGSFYLFIKLAVAEILPVTLIAIRVTIAANCLSAIVGAVTINYPAQTKPHPPSAG